MPCSWGTFGTSPLCWSFPLTQICLTGAGCAHPGGTLEGGVGTRWLGVGWGKMEVFLEEGTYKLGLWLVPRSWGDSLLGQEEKVG